MKATTTKRPTIKGALAKLAKDPEALAWMLLNAVESNYELPAAEAAATAAAGALLDVFEALENPSPELEEYALYAVCTRLKDHRRLQRHWPRFLTIETARRDPQDLDMLRRLTAEHLAALEDWPGALAQACEAFAWKAREGKDSVEFYMEGWAALLDQAAAAGVDVKQARAQWQRACECTPEPKPAPKPVMQISPSARACGMLAAGLIRLSDEDPGIVGALLVNAMEAWLKGENFDRAEGCAGELARTWYLAGGRADDATEREILCAVCMPDKDGRLPTDAQAAAHFPRLLALQVAAMPDNCDYIRLAYARCLGRLGRWDEALQQVGQACAERGAWAGKGFFDFDPDVWAALLDQAAAAGADVSACRAQLDLARVVDDAAWSRKGGGHVE